MIMAKKLPYLEMNRDLGRDGAANDRCLESCKHMKRAWLCVTGRPHPAEPQTLTPFFFFSDPDTFYGAKKQRESSESARWHEMGF